MSPADQEAGERLRFMYYIRALEDSGWRNPAWRRPYDEIRSLIDLGAKARALQRHATTREERRSAFETLKRANSGLRAADDWNRRRRDSLSRLEPEVGRALEELVRKGCVPDQLLECLEILPHRDRPAVRARPETTAHRRRLEQLERELLRAVADCDRINDLEIRGLAGRLFDAAVLIDDVLRSGPRRRVNRTQWAWTLFNTMREIKLMTGKYHDQLVVDLLKDTAVSPGRTPDALRKWRAREESRWAVKSPGAAAPAQRGN